MFVEFVPFRIFGVFFFEGIVLVPPKKIILRQTKWHSQGEFFHLLHRDVFLSTTKNETKAFDT
jgi:hypothetical protein